MFVYYDNGEEVIVTTRKQEGQMLEEYFNQDGRDPSDYKRRTTSISECAVHVIYRLKASLRVT